MDLSAAICIPTYERSALVNDFLENCAGFYTELGLDIYFYDSSQGDETRELVRRWEGKGHIYYVRLPSSTPVSDKIIRIFQGNDWKKRYDFVSLSNDATQYSPEDMRRILDSLSLEYDFVVFDNKPDAGTRIYTDPNEFLLSKCESYHFGASMLNVHTMLSGLDWGVYGDWLRRYGDYSFYFRRFSELPSFRALHVEITTRRNSAYKKQSFYNKDTLFHGIQAALIVYASLPEIYTNRWAACRQFTTAAYFGNEQDFILFRRQGAFDLDRYLEYEDVWDKVTDVSKEALRRIALTPLEQLEEDARRTMERGEARLKAFFQAHESISIYGAGNHGAAYCAYFERMGMRFDSFTVSRRKPGKFRFMDHPVVVFGETENRDGIGYIAALFRPNAQEVLPVLYAEVGEEHVFYDCEFETEMRYQMGYQAYSAI